ncbi:MAG: hypothetical protein A2075_09095 [Geobacteraceae bacterium GWC2_58_44]|nr:MAG: hypothetical protein A2075_09095 [Geobacteraceae bacterium GWC2_58_44]HBG07669.1 hypothetical protein [Geobacter sp.]
MPESTQHIIIGIVIYKVVELLVQLVFKRLSSNDFVTKKSCDDCSSRDNVAMTRLTGEIAIIKGILLVIAVKGEVPAEDLAKLTQYTS